LTQPVANFPKQVSMVVVELRVLLLAAPVVEVLRALALELEVKLPNVQENYHGHRHCSLRSNPHGDPVRLRDLLGL
jgi:hypothetical protein